MAHPQIAAFARLAKENAQPARLLAGQKTLLSRTMHDIRYDAVHDEFLVTNPFAQAILVFRGGADGEEAPVRIIQGPATMLKGTGAAAGGADRLDVDPVHDEIYVPAGDDEAILFSVNDIPVFQALGLYREEPEVSLHQMAAPMVPSPPEC